MSHKIYTVLIVVALGLGVFIGKSYYSQTKTVEIEKEIVRNDIIIREIIKPDGTKETITTDKSTSKRDSTNTQIVAVAKPDWHISASVSKNVNGLEPIYGLQIERRILGPFSVGIRADSQKNIGLIIGYEF